MFERSSSGNYSYLHFAPWSERGIRHGFLAGGVEAGESDADAGARFRVNFGVPLRLLKQVHGTTACPFNAPSGPLEADGWNGDRVSSQQAFGVKTADCVPVMFLSGSRIALLHIGWRGLAAGFAAKVLREWNSTSGVEALIGPAASATRYVIQPELVKNFLHPPITNWGPTGELTLDLVGTILRDIQQAADGRARIYATYQCTISNVCFQSHRRDGASAGRNLSFVVG